MSTKTDINVALKRIGKNGFDGISAQGTNAVLALANLLSSKSPIDYQRTVSELRRQKLAEISQAGNEVVFKLTPAGAYRLQKLAIEELVIRAPKKWDKKWRVVIFDIPLQSSKNRSYFTLQLKRLGMKMVQKSVWVHPYDCRDEIFQIAGYYNLGRYCSFFEVDELDKMTQKILKNHFTNLN